VGVRHAHRAPACIQEELEAIDRTRESIALPKAASSEVRLSKKERSLLTAAETTSMKVTLFGLLFVLVFPAQAPADELVVKMTLVNKQGIGKEIGTVTATDSKYGLILKPQLGGLMPGVHGFHNQRDAAPPAAKKTPAMRHTTWGGLTAFEAIIPPPSSTRSIPRSGDQSCAVSGTNCCSFTATVRYCSIRATSCSD
jgi:hypothetical protein